MKKPTIAELEQILDGNSLPIKIMPNGEVKMDFENCIWKEECASHKLRNAATEAGHGGDSIHNSGIMAAPKPCAAWDLGHTCEVFENMLCDKKPCLLTRTAS